jgi:hypothetical protein
MPKVLEVVPPVVQHQASLPSLWFLPFMSSKDRSHVNYLKLFPYLPPYLLTYLPTYLILVLILLLFQPHHLLCQTFLSIQVHSVGAGYYSNV